MAPMRPVEPEDDDPGTPQGTPAPAAITPGAAPGRASAGANPPRATTTESSPAGTTTTATSPAETTTTGTTTTVGVRRASRWRGGAKGGRGAQTTLVDLSDDLAPEDVAAGDPTEVEAAGPARRRLGRWFVVGGAAVLVVGAVIGQQVLDARRDAHDRRFDDVPGVLVPLDSPPVVREGVTFRWVYDPVQVGAVAVVSREVPGTDASVRVEAIDRATGDVAWRRDIDVPPDLLELVRTDTEPAAVTCKPLGTVAAACVVTTGTLMFGGGVSDLLVVLDASDGTVLDRRSFDAEAWTTSGTSILTSDAGRDESRPGREHWSVESRPGLAPGAVEWTWTADEPIVHEDGMDHAGGSWLSVSGDRVLVTASDHWYLLDGRGALVQDGQREDDDFVSLARGGALSVTDPLSSTLDDSYLLVGGARVDAGMPLDPTVDDGSAPEVAFTFRFEDAVTVLEAWDATTGTRLWDRRVLSEPLLLDGRVYLLGSGEVAAVDARTGDEIWTAGAGDQASWLATDGRRVLCLGSSAHARALDLDSGEVVWDSSVAGATTGLWAFQGLLMAPEGNLENPRLVVPRP